MMLTPEGDKIIKYAFIWFSFSRLYMYKDATQIYLIEIYRLKTSSTVKCIQLKFSGKILLIY